MKVPYSEPNDARWGGIIGPDQAPIVELSFAQVFTPSDRKEQYALLDTGADITAFPEGLTTMWGWRPIGTKVCKAAFGPERDLNMYAVNLTIFTIDINYLPVVGLPIKYPLLGRDVINRFSLLLDGPNRQLSLYQENLINKLLN